MTGGKSAYECRQPGGGARPVKEQPRHQPWRYAHDVVTYLSLAFFDAALGVDMSALARLDPVVVNGFDDLRFESK